MCVHVHLVILVACHLLNDPLINTAFYIIEHEARYTLAARGPPLTCVHPCSMLIFN